MKPQYLLALFMLGAIWGASFPFIKVGLESYGPITIVALRLGGGAIILLLFARFQGHTLPTDWRSWRDMLLIGVIGMATPFALIGWGEQYINSGLAAILIATTPLLTMLMALVWMHEERLSIVKTIGVLIGFGGVAVAVNIMTLDIFSADALAQGAILLAALGYAFVGNYGRRAFRSRPPIVSAAGTQLGGALVTWPIALLFEGAPTLAPTGAALFGIVGLTVLSTAFAYILYYWTLERLGASRTSMVTYLVPVFALLFGWLWLNEAIYVHTILGLLLVILGIMIANGILFRGRTTTVTTARS
jgi:drug/metabolite transporter (DMT)-like permease